MKKFLTTIAVCFAGLFSAFSQQLDPENNTSRMRPKETLLGQKSKAQVDASTRILISFNHLKL